MGFNLSSFFEELEYVLSLQEATPEEKLEALRSTILFNKKYAKQSGQLE